MCSVGDDNLEDLEHLKYMPIKEPLSSCSKCNKCRERTPIVVLRSKDKYCKECFLAGTVHKFKALLGKHKLIRPSDRVLIVHKCGHAGTALLHFVRTGIDLGTHKKLRFEPLVLFIEDHSYLSVKERQELVQNVEKEIVRFNFVPHLSTLRQLIFTEDVSTVLEDKSDLLKFNDDDKSVIDNFVNKQSNVTNNVDYLTILRHKILVDIAKQLHCKFIFTPELSNDVASQLLTDITLGRGSQATLNSGFCDSRDDVKILRPLRLFDVKELAFYNFLNNLEPVVHKVSPSNQYQSVQQLMKRFVTDLQVNYPATVTTILKTGDKLASNGKMMRNCRLCKAPIDEENSELTSAESIQFSHWVSTQKADSSTSTSSQKRYTDILDGFKNFTSDIYCFGCTNLIE